jgi:sodium-dependent dicarboxylate transporter 2/3/5
MTSPPPPSTAPTTTSPTGTPKRALQGALSLIARLALGPLLCMGCFFEPIPLISTDAWRVIGLTLWVVSWWITEAIPIGATSLLPIPFLALTGVSSLNEAAAPYGSPIVFLFLGGFLLAIALERWGLHKRVALRILSLTGTRANGVSLGFLLSTAALSMWMSNTATALMMLPIATSVLSLTRGGRRGDELSEGERRLGAGLMLAVAYGANIGGAMTLIGTPPNLVLASFFERELGQTISFMDWLRVGVPFGVGALIVTHLILTRVFFRTELGELVGAREALVEARASLGAWSAGEVRVAFVFLCTALAWALQGYLRALPGLERVDDTTVALVGAMALFVLPDGQGGRLLTWSDTHRLPWDIVLLFGGGLTLAAALKEVGVMQALGDQLGHIGASAWMGVALMTAVALALTEVMSNVALVTVFVPVVSGVAIGTGVPPLSLCMPVTLAASCAFMLPMSTPPNAIVFATGELRVGQMALAGLALNLVCLGWITLLARYLLL